MAANWSGMESALKAYFEDISEPNDAKTFTLVGKKIADEYATAIGTAADTVGNLVTSVSQGGIASAYADEFQAQFDGASPSFANVMSEVTSCNEGLTLAFLIPDGSVSMVTGAANEVTDGGTGNRSEYKSAFAMAEDMTAAKTAQRITTAMKNHFNGNATKLSGVTSAPSNVSSNLSLS